METITCIDTKSYVSDITYSSDSCENIELNIEVIKNTLMNDLNKLTTDTLRDKCKEHGISGISKLKKNELVTMLYTNFDNMITELHSKAKNELKILGKSCNVKKISTSKKEYLIYHILSYHATNMLFKLDNTSIGDDMNVGGINIRAFFEGKKKCEEAEKEGEEKEAKKRAEEEEAKKEVEEEAKKRAEKEEAKKKKQSIPKNVRMIVWNHYIGEDIIKHKCLCCKKVTIVNTNFDVGHVLSEKHGGTHEINNLRPICGSCNHSMGTENMIDFVVKFGLYIG